MIRITHFRKKCIGCNYCVELSPYRWFINQNDGRINLKGAKEKKGIYILLTSDDEYEINKEAADVCPVNIIRIERF